MLNEYGYEEKYYSKEVIVDEGRNMTRTLELNLLKYFPKKNQSHKIYC